MSDCSSCGGANNPATSAQGVATTTTDVAVVPPPVHVYAGVAAFIGLVLGVVAALQTPCGIP